MVSFILKKLSIDDPDAGTAINEGHVTYGCLLNLFNINGEIISSPELQQIEPGWRIFMTTEGLGYHVTSRIKEIVSREGNIVIFKTQTSTYKLEKLNEHICN